MVRHRRFRGHLLRGVPPGRIGLSRPYSEYREERAKSSGAFPEAALPPAPLGICCHGICGTYLRVLDTIPARLLAGSHLRRHDEFVHADRKRFLQQPPSAGLHSFDPGVLGDSPWARLRHHHRLCALQPDPDGVHGGMFRLSLRLDRREALATGHLGPRPRCLVWLHALHRDLQHRYVERPHLLSSRGGDLSAARRPGPFPRGGCEGG